MNPNHPQSFHGAPTYASNRPAPTPVAAEPAGGWAPAPSQLPTLTVRPNGDVTITKALLAALPHLKDRAPIDLVPPVQRGRGGTWHLDTRPTAPRRLPDARKVARFSIPPPPRHHFNHVAPGPGRGHRQQSEGRKSFDVPHLVFRLGAEVMEQVCLTDSWGKPVCEWRGTGYYALVPVRETCSAPIA